ncbi:MAG: thioredoxin domain-containing protein [Bacteroidales bacterium]|jgi:thioredoxin|nr:thioredoxin domain-containing protein [Bacteroidales bacterium]
MKKTFLISLIALISISQGCKGNSKEKIDTDKNSTSNEEVVNDNKTTKSEEGSITLSTAEFKEKVMNYEVNKEWKFEGDLPCIVDFYADWCGPCKIASPILDEIAKEYKGKINVYKIDTQKDQEVAQVFRVKGIPAFLYCPKDGKPQMRSGIGQSKEQTKEMFRKAIDEVLLNKN